MKNIVLCDLDGTLADITHRLHYIKDGKKDWPGFFRACVDDVPITSTIAVVNSLYCAGLPVFITSGRSDEVMKQTAEWLDRHEIMHSRLLMRRAGDYRADDVIKREWLTSGLILRESVLCAFDDRQRVVDMWRSEGITCFQVADGDF